MTNARRSSGACAPARRKFETALLAGRQVRFDAATEAPLLVAYRNMCGEETESVRETNVAHVAMIERRASYLTAHRRLEMVNRLEAKARTTHPRGGPAVPPEQAEFDDFAGRNAFRTLLSA